MLIDLAEHAGARASLGDIVDALSDRSFAPLMLLFAAPNVLPLRPGSSTIFAIPLILLATQLLLGWQHPWLPRWLRDRSLERARFRSLAIRLQPSLQRFEKLARPRHWLMPHRVAERFVGFLVLVMALVLILPIPFGNGIPAWAIMFVALGLSERDGVWLALGVLTAAGFLGLLIGIIGSVGFATGHLVR
ncbi:MAG: exopolysaccharide biosynthesis protein [Alphaproteobacteria bacterium]